MIIIIIIPLRSEILTSTVQGCAGDMTNAVEVEPLRCVHFCSIYIKMLIICSLTLFHSPEQQNKT